jgi:hypothetical protein
MIEGSIGYLVFKKQLLPQLSIMRTNTSIQESSSSKSASVHTENGSKKPSIQPEPNKSSSTHRQASPNHQLGKRCLQEPVENLERRVDEHTHITQEARYAMNMITPFLELEKDPIVKKAKQTKKAALKRIRRGMNQMVVSTAKLSNKFHDDPAFDKKLETHPRKAIDNLDIVDNLDILINKNDELKANEVKYIEKLLPDKKAKQDEAEKLTHIIKSRPENVERNQFQRRYNLDEQFEEADTFYHSKVSRLATCLGKTPFLCIKCWSILFSTQSLVIFGDLRIRIKVPCSEVFGRTSSLGNPACKRLVEDWQDCSEKLLPTSDVQNEFQKYFPCIILPENEIEHDCWSQEKGANTQELKSWIKYIKSTHSAKQSLKILKGLESHNVEVESLGLSSIPEKKDRQKKSTSAPKAPLNSAKKQPEVQNVDIDQPPAPNATPVISAQNSLLKVGAKDRVVTDLTSNDLKIKIPGGPVARSLKSFIVDDLPNQAPTKKPRRAHVDLTDLAETQMMGTRDMNSRHSSVDSSTDLATKDHPTVLKDLKNSDEKWKWFCYRVQGTEVRIQLDILSEAWLEN